MKLTSIQQLFDERIRQVRSIIGNWKIHEVKEDTAYAASLERLKAATLLKPVSISDPEVDTHRQEEADYGPTYDNPFGGRRRRNVVTVKYSVSGSGILLKYSPNGYQFSSSDTVVYQPVLDELKIDVVVDALDKSLVFQTAEREIKTTIRHIAQVNPVAESWSQSAEGTLQNLADAKRKELIDFYDK